MEKGIVQIADDVIAVIAQISALEVEGMKSIAVLKQDFVKTLTRKKQVSGIKVMIGEKGSQVSIAIKGIVYYGVNVKKVCVKVQEKVKSSIETMTGIKVLRVDVQIVGVATNPE